MSATLPPIPVRPTAWQRVQRGWVRATTAWPALRSILPFVPLLVAWWLTAAFEVFPKAFFPGPADVARTFVALVYKGIRPEDLADSVGRRAAGAAVRAAVRFVARISQDPPLDQDQLPAQFPAQPAPKSGKSKHTNKGRVVSTCAYVAHLDPY